MDFNRLYSFILDLISLYNIYGTAISYHAFGENKKRQNCNAETETKKKYMKKLMGCQDKRVGKEKFPPNGPTQHR